MKNALLSIVVCPLCKSPLHLARAESLLVCRAERLSFPVVEDQPVLLESRARSLSVEETDHLTRNQGIIPND